MKSFTFTLALSLLAPSAAATTTACYSTPGQLIPSLHSVYQSRSLCQHHCSKTNHSVAALHGTACFCGSPADIPPDSAKRPLSDCHTPCPGYPTDTCGGPNAWTILVSGLHLHRRIDPAAESVIVTAPDTHAAGAPPDPLASLSVNPTVVQTGVPLPTGSAGAIDGFKTAPIPNSILTAPSEPSASKGGSTTVSSAGALPTSTTTTTVASAAVTTRSATGSAATASGTASPSASPSGAAAGRGVPGGGLLGVLSVVVALLY